MAEPVSSQQEATKRGPHMREGRWTTVTESEYGHEHRGLESIREKLPDADPWRAWSNFTFTANTGHVREIDLLVVAPGGVCMIELKNWHGSLTSENGTWVQTTPTGRRVTHGNPLHLVNKKAKELAGLLGQNGKRVWVAEAVCFTADDLRVRLPAHDENGVYTITELVAMLNQPPRDERRRITAIDPREIKTALERVGVRPSDARYKVGPYELKRKAFDSGETWADYLAEHTELPEVARVRIYLRERDSDASIRQSVESAARREAAVLRRFRHPGSRAWEAESEDTEPSTTGSRGFSGSLLSPSASPPISPPTRASTTLVRSKCGCQASHRSRWSASE